MIWLLLVIMQFKHFIADYPLQGRYMLGKFKETHWLAPLASHCAVHLAFTFTIGYFVLHDFTKALTISMIDFNVHFFMDRIKASPFLLGRFKALSKTEMISAINMSKGLSMISGAPMPEQIDEASLKNYKDIGNKDLKSNTYFWWSLGLDQMVHHLTDILVIYLMIG